MNHPHPQPAMAGDPDLEGLAPRVSLWRISKFIAALLWRSDQSTLKIRIWAALILTVAAKGLAVAGPLFLGEAVNLLTENPGQLGNFAVLVLLWAAFRFLSQGGPYIRDYFFSRVNQQAQRLVASQFFEHVLHLSVPFHQTKRTGALQRVMERGARGVDFLLRFLCFNIGPTLIELIVAAAILAFRFGPLFSLLAVVTVFAYSGLTMGLTEWRVRHRREMNRTDQKAMGRVVDAIGNIETVKSFAAEKRETSTVDQALGTYAAAAALSSQSLALLNGVQALIMTLGLMGMALLAGREVVNGTMGPGDILAVILILTNIYQPLNILGWAWREIKQSVVDMEKLFQLMDSPPDIVDQPGAIDLPTGSSSLIFDNVSFRHMARQVTIDDVSFQLQPGQFFGIAGPSGSGKSTLLRLILRFYEVDQGAVLIGGEDIRQIRQASLRHGIGFVPQEVVLFNDSLLENIRYGDPDASAEQIARCVADAGLEKFVTSLPEGLATLVGERGLKLSGGERQRVGLARALLKNPDILLLDEATSALDSRTEAQVQRALASASRGRTALAVAHRLSTIAHADQILVLDGGRIVQQGRHESLINQPGLYAQMWKKQSEEEGRGQISKNTVK